MQSSDTGRMLADGQGPRARPGSGHQFPGHQLDGRPCRPGSATCIWQSASPSVADSPQPCLRIKDMAKLPKLCEVCCLCHWQGPMRVGRSLDKPASLGVVFACKYGGDISCSSLMEVLMIAPNMLRLPPHSVVWRLACSAASATTTCKMQYVRAGQPVAEAPFCACTCPCPCPCHQAGSSTSATGNPNPEQTTRELYNSQVHAWSCFYPFAMPFNLTPYSPALPTLRGLG